MQKIYPLETHCLTAAIALQDKILRDLGPRDPLFSDIQLVVTQKEDTLLNELTFPEYLLNLSGSIANIANKPLTSRHALFERLNKTIEILEKKADYYPEPLKSSLQKIGVAYKDYILKVCQSTEKEKKRLLKGPCRLYGIFHGKVECRQLTQKQGRSLSCLAKDNRNEKTNEYGASIVKKKGEIFYKRKAFNPLHPGMEYAVEHLNTLISQGGAPPTQLLKINNLCVNQGKDRVEHIFQVSHEVPGMNLRDFLKNPQEIDLYSFTSMFILALEFGLISLL